MVNRPVTCLVTDYGGTISLDRIDHVIGQKPVDPEAAAALRVLHDDLGMRLVLGSNTQPHETRWPALQQAGIDGLFAAAVLSYSLGVRKPSPVFYQVVLAAAGCPAGQVLFVGDHLENDAAAPARHGMQAALVRWLRSPRIAEAFTAIERRCERSAQPAGRPTRFRRSAISRTTAGGRMRHGPASA